MRDADADVYGRMKQFVCIFFLVACVICAGWCATMVAVGCWCAAHEALTRGDKLILFLAWPAATLFFIMGAITNAARLSRIRSATRRGFPVEARDTTIGAGSNLSLPPLEHRESAND